MINSRYESDRPRNRADTTDYAGPLTEERGNSRFLSRQYRRTKQRDKATVHIRNMDITIYLVVTILMLIGVVMVFSASYVRAANMAVHNHDAFYFLRRNGLFAIGGFIVMNVIAQFSYEILRPFVVIIYVAAIGLLIAVIIGGLAVGGAARWLALPVIGQFQPSEVAKAALIFMIAYLVEKYPKALHTWPGFFIMCGVVGIIAALVAIPGGFSAMLIISAIGLGMIFIASPYFLRFVLFGLGAAAAVGGYLWFEFTFGTGFRGARFGAWLDPWADPMDSGFQIIQSLLAVGSGGLFGLGIGQSRQASFLPEPHNDMIFAIIVEELGFIGGAMIIVLFGILIWRGVIVVLRAPDTFSSMVAIGIVFAIASQTVINIAVVTNSIPNTGVTLPFISYGGTSLLVSMALAGVLLSISKYTKERR